MEEDLIADLALSTARLARPGDPSNDWLIALADLEILKVREHEFDQ